MDNLKREALALSWKERLELAQLLLESLHQVEAKPSTVENLGTPTPFLDPEAGHNLETDLCSPPSMRKIDLRASLVEDNTSQTPVPTGAQNLPPSSSKALASDHDIAEGFEKLREALGSSVGQKTELN